MLDKSYIDLEESVGSMVFGQVGRDSENYKYAVISVFDEVVYVSFTDVSHGKTSIHPTCRGIDRFLKREPMTFFNMSMSKGDDHFQPSLNDTAYDLHTKYNYSATTQVNTGLTYGRVHDVVFDSIGFQESNNYSAFPSLLDYAERVKSGGQLLGLNMNGYGYIANYLFNTHTSSSLLLSIKVNTSSDNIGICNQPRANYER
ncbi:MAG: hypothetical protein DLM72_11170 [Candidatus Nitrosopolaris wilkensis]|nr:MAG: hypothetical protein DLM72_11170 [Candidatus Nitrosopolaris wilkensis]